MYVFGIKMSGFYKCLKMRRDVPKKSKLTLKKNIMKENQYIF